MKYIIATNEVGMTVGLMFDAHFRHKDVAKCALREGSVMRAGICTIKGGRVVCGGESKSLGVTAYPKADAVILERMLKA